MLLVYLRIIALLAFTFFCFILVLLFYPFLPQRQWVHFVKMWANGILLFVGAKVITETHSGTYREKNAMVIANHISWLDIPILYTQHSVGFVGRNELKKWPVLNLLIKSGSTIFIDRNRKRDLVHINLQVSEKLKTGATVGLFPEGKTGDGRQLLPFKPALLEAAFIADATIIPLVIQYYTKNGEPTNAPTYAGDITLWQSLRSILMLNGIKIKITALPRNKARDFKNREELSAHLYTQINTQFQEYLNRRHDIL